MIKTKQQFIIDSIQNIPGNSGDILREVSECLKEKEREGDLSGFTMSFLNSEYRSCHFSYAALILRSLGYEVEYSLCLKQKQFKMNIIII